MCFTLPVGKESKRSTLPGLSVAAYLSSLPADGIFEPAPSLGIVRQRALADHLLLRDCAEKLVFSLWFRGGSMEYAVHG